MAKSTASSTNTTKRTGIADLDKKLEQVSGKSARKAVRSGTNAGLKVLVTSIKSEVDASDASTQLKRSLKRTVGKKFGKSKGGAKKGTIEAKAGLGIGTRKKAVKRSGKSRGGVGIGAHNVVWFALGTGPRTVYSTGKPSGRIEAIPAVRRAFQKSEKEALKVFRQHLLNKLDEEVKRIAGR